MPENLKPKSEFELESEKNIIEYHLNLPPQITELVEFISDSKGRSFLVGGSVRDAVISKLHNLEYSIKDFDLEVYDLEPENLKNLLKQRYGSVNEVGNSFGVIKVNLDGIEEPVDVSIPRIDSKDDSQTTDSTRGRGINAVSNPDLDLVKATQRRDITINSILYDPLNEILVDPFGGYQDIIDQKIRMTDEETFKEDPLRVLRVAQFASRFGFEVSEDTFNEAKELVSSGELDSLVVERLREELDKLLEKGFEPSVGLRFLKDIGYLSKIMPELTILETIEQEKDYHPEGNAYIHSLQVIDAMSDIARREIKKGTIPFSLKKSLILAALCHDLGKTPTTIIEDNKIKSPGHEEAGIPLTRDLIRRIYKDEDQKKLFENEKLIDFLVAEHRAPVELYNEYMRGVNVIKGLRKLKLKAEENGCSLGILGLIVEADLRGRNSESSTEILTTAEALVHLKKDGEISTVFFPEFAEWWQKVSEELNTKDSEVVFKKLLNVDSWREVYTKGDKKLNGAWISIIDKCVELDQRIDEDITSPDEASERADFYLNEFLKKSSYENIRDLLLDKSFWKDLTLFQDPRDFLKN